MPTCAVPEVPPVPKCPSVDVLMDCQPVDIEVRRCRGITSPVADAADFTEKNDGRIFDVEVRLV
jgi:hypothetical protein